VADDTLSTLSGKKADPDVRQTARMTMSARSFSASLPGARGWPPDRASLVASPAFLPAAWRRRPCDRGPGASSVAAAPPAATPLVACSWGWH